MISKKVLRIEIQNAPLEKSYQMSVGNRQLDWLEISTVYEKSDKHNTVSLREKYPYSELFTSAFSRISLRIQSECEKMRTRRTPNTDTFYAVSTIATMQKSQRIL